MTVFVPESIKVLGSDAGGASVVLCDMFVDDLAGLPAPDAYTGYKLSMGCTATVINDNSRHRINSVGQWVQISAGTSTYTKTEIDSMIARIDATEAEDRAALIGQVDGGAKNHCTLASGSSTPPTRWINIPVSNVGVGQWVMSFGTLISTDTDDTLCQSTCFNSSDQQVSNWVNFKRESNTNKIFTVTDTVSYVRLYPANSYAASVGDTVTFTNGMICTASDYAISPAFVPYAPTNRQLYELIKQYHP